MAEYIGKEQLLSHLFSKQDDPLDVMKEIAEFPAADVAEVRRAHWEFPIFMDSDDGLDPRVKCSECGSIEAAFARWKYCPNCGALMKEDEHEAD